MALSRIVMRLARNPGTEFADGDDHRGFTLTAPLTAEGKLDGAAARKGGCKVRRFAPADDIDEGVLGFDGKRWTFAYDGDDPEPAPHLGEHRFAVGEYVSLPDDDGRLLAYKVTEIIAL
jgi:hypothetical protein